MVCSVQQPLRLASGLGLLLAGLGGLYALVVAVVRLMNDVPVPGWAALMVAVLLTSGTQLLILGIIGEYLWRNLDATRRRPLFVVESVVNLSDCGGERRLWHSDGHSMSSRDQ